jgi:hypothetical protein
LAIAYKNFAAHQGVSHIGLGVSALNTAKVLRAHGIRVEVWPLAKPSDLRATIALHPDVTHVVVNAAWVPASDLAQLCMAYGEKQFFVNSHSNIGFLQADRNGVKLFREYMELEQGLFNFHFAGNSVRFCEWINHGLRSACTYLPNIYYIDDITDQVRASHYNGGPLHIGCFGAIRSLKNMMTAAAAALELQAKLRVPLEYWMSGGRQEGEGSTVLAAVRAMLEGLPGVNFHLVNWASWPQFRRILGSMNLLLQPSYTESFNMVTADGVAMQVPSVVSEAIDWAPNSWKADVDDALDIARVGRHLLHDCFAAAEGLHALNKHNREGVVAWKRILFV